MQAAEFASRPGDVLGVRPQHSAALGALRIGAFFGLVTLLALVLDHAIDLGLRGIPTGEFGIWNQILQGRVNADVLVSGSSRALTHYDTRILREATGRKVYNIGLNGSQTDMQLARLKAYLRHNRKPDLLIQNLDAFSFQVSHGEAYDPGQYIPYLDEPDLYKALARINPEVWKSRYVPLYGYAVDDMRFGWLIGLRDGLRSGREDVFIDGFKPRESTWTGEFERFRSHNPGGVEIRIESEGVLQLEELLRLCAAQGIRVVLAYSPEYTGMQSLTLNRAEILGRFEVLGRQYGAQFMDFSNSPISSRREYFYNSQHLNAAGASAFTRELAGRLQAANAFALKDSGR